MDRSCFLPVLDSKKEGNTISWNVVTNDESTRSNFQKSCVSAAPLREPHVSSLIVHSHPVLISFPWGRTYYVIRSLPVAASFQKNPHLFPLPLNFQKRVRKLVQCIFQKLLFSKAWSDNCLTEDSPYSVFTVT